MHAIIGVGHIIAGWVGITLSWPLLSGLIHTNRAYSFHFAQSFRSDECNRRINRYGARTVIGWSCILMIVGVISFFLPIGGSEALLFLYELLPIIVIFGSAYAQILFFARRL